jgi:hypothetical protein
MRTYQYTAFTVLDRYDHFIFEIRFIILTVNLCTRAVTV